MQGALFRLPSRWSLRRRRSTVRGIVGTLGVLGVLGALTCDNDGVEADASWTAFVPL